MSIFRFVYSPESGLSPAELSAACLDGHLVALGEGFVPADVVETAALRAASLAPILADDLAATHTSAAWIWGGIDAAPPRHDVQRAVPLRLHHRIGRRFVYRDPAVPAADLRRLGGVWVTTPARTAADLARTPGGAYADVLRAWAARDDSLAQDALAWFDGRERLPHRRAATRLLAAIRTT